MLATLVERPFHHKGWAYEEKYDGYRILVYKEGGKVTLLSRNQKDRTASFQGIADDVARLAPRTLLLDGEAVAFDRKLVSRFQLLQQGEVPVVLAAFDCLYANGLDLRDLPLTERRAALEQVVDGAEQIFVARRLAANGLTAYRQAEKKGFEGLVAKDTSAPYVSGRSRRWLKVKAKKEDEFVIGGYTEPAGLRSRFGALLVGGYRDGKLYYTGKVGTGFSEERLDSLWRAFQKIEVAKPPFVDPPRGRGLTWVEPKLVAQVAYTEWTADRKLRQPVFLGLRDDKDPRDSLLPGDAP